MIKIQTPHQTASSVTSFSSLKQSQTYRNSMLLSPVCVPYMNRESAEYPTHKITVSQNQLEKQKQILEWRQNTDFPITKVRSYKILNEKHTFGMRFFEILVQLESQMKTFNDMKKLPFFQAIYVLKESMIGFERLCHRFGFFKMSAKMIMFNETQNCKVWVNQNLFLNFIHPSEIRSEKQFISEVINVVQEKTVKSKMSTDFFDKVRSCKYFFETICSIDGYVRVSKIKIPTKLQNLDEIKSPLLKTSLTMDLNMVEQKQKNLVNSSKIPRFIKKCSIKKKASFQPYTPTQRKMTTVTQACLHDHSFTNVSRNHSSNSFLKNQYEENNKVDSKENQKFDEDTFLKDLNIRLIEPNNNDPQVFIPSSPHFPSEYLSSPESPFSPLGMVSELDFNQDKNSGFSFNKCVSKQEFSTFESAERMFLTVFKFSNGNDRSPSKKLKPQYSPRCIKTLQYLDTVDVESLEDFEHQSNQKTFLPLSINQIRDKRKLSGDYDNSSSRADLEVKVNENEEVLTPQYKSKNFLNVPNMASKKIGLIKSPSHQVFLQSRNKQDFELEEEEKEQEEREFLRQTIMNKNGWKGLQIVKGRKPIQQSFVDDNEQIQAPQQSKTSQLPKLGGMGRDVKTSMINDFEFELEFGSQIQKEKSIRDEVSCLLD